jgi:hypothetical protein
MFKRERGTSQREEPLKRDVLFKRDVLSRLSFERNLSKGMWFLSQKRCSSSQKRCSSSQKRRAIKARILSK